MAEISTKSIKHAVIERNNSFVVGMVAGAVFVVVFCGFAINALISQSLYQQRVIDQKQTALDTLRTNEQRANDLNQSYQAFASQQINILGASPTGDGPLDGDNPKIVLDALPSEYDYPALASSVEKLLVDGGFSIESIGGREDIGIAQQNAASSSSTVSKEAAKPVEIPYPINVAAGVDESKALLETFEKSIRPFRFDTLSITSQGDSLSMAIGMVTYFQPQTGLQVTEVEVE